jgi:hypothetical protein
MSQILFQQVSKIADWRVWRLIGAYGTGWAQWAQRRAASGISLRHSGQVFMDNGASGAGFLMRASSVFKGRTMPK